MAQRANLSETRHLTSHERRTVGKLANRIAGILEAGNYQTDARTALYEALQLLDYLASTEDAISGDLADRALKAASQALELAKVPPAAFTIDSTKGE